MEFDYKVGDTVICVRASGSLMKGRLYKVHKMIKQDNRDTYYSIYVEGEGIRSSNWNYSHKCFKKYVMSNEARMEARRKELCN